MNWTEMMKYSPETEYLFIAELCEHLLEEIGAIDTNDFYDILYVLMRPDNMLLYASLMRYIRKTVTMEAFGAMDVSEQQSLVCVFLASGARSFHARYKNSIN